MTYRAREPFLAFRYDPSVPRRFITITVGSIVTLQSDVHPSGLVSVLYNGQIVSAFMKDIEARAEVVEDTSAQCLVRRDDSRAY